MVTQSDMWPMRGRTVLVTGGTGGIGYHTARFLARWGAQVLITGREPASAVSRRPRPSAARAARNGVGSCRPTTPPWAATRSWPTRCARLFPSWMC